jgi:NAD(P)-dependent dehydrogenase (short-subunit alcohol dehydrogenase family)
VSGGLAIVTGAGGALGHAVVTEFVATGVRVIAVARSVEDVASLVAVHPDAVAAEAADLTDPDEVAALWQRLDERGAVPNFLVNTAGAYRGGTLVESGVDDYRDMFAVNIDTAWWSCREAARRMSELGGGGIVNVASRTAVHGGAGSIAYAVAKAAVIKLSQVLADELKDAGVRVNAVLPAVIDTPANAAVMPAARMAKAVPAESIAKVIVFLCGPDASPISGAAIPAYGRY